MCRWVTICTAIIIDATFGTLVHSFVRPLLVPGSRYQPALFDAVGHPRKTARCWRLSMADLRSPLLPFAYTYAQQHPQSASTAEESVLRHSRVTPRIDLTQVGNYETLYFRWTMIYGGQNLINWNREVRSTVVTISRVPRCWREVGALFFLFRCRYWAIYDRLRCVDFLWV